VRPFPFFLLSSAEGGRFRALLGEEKRRRVGVELDDGYGKGGRKKEMVSLFYGEEPGLTITSEKEGKGEGENPPGAERDKKKEKSLRYFTYLRESVGFFFCRRRKEERKRSVGTRGQEKRKGPIAKLKVRISTRKGKVTSRFTPTGTKERERKKKEKKAPKKLKAK